MIAPIHQRCMNVGGSFFGDRIKTILYEKRGVSMTGNFDDIERDVVAIIVEKLSVDRDAVVPEAHFIDDLGADSLDLVDLMMAFEEFFDIEISDEEANEMLTVQQVIDYIIDHE